jgi:hypothetical protein
MQRSDHRGNTVQTTDERMEDEPPSRLNSWVKLHVPGPTHVAHEAACTPSSMCSLLHTLELHALPLPGLRIKIYLSHHFGIIINYYSQGLKPSSLAPLPTFQPPFPYPFCGSLVPHHSFFVVGRHTTMFIYYINDLHNYIYKNRLLAFNT